MGMDVKWMGICGVERVVGMVVNGMVFMEMVVFIFWILERNGESVSRE